jgi:hypothetical protein
MTGSGTTAPQAFPDGARLIVGDSKARSKPDPNLVPAEALSFDCDDDHSHHQGFPTQCTSGITISIHFPSCWNGNTAVTGVDDSADYKYPHQNGHPTPENGDCPVGFEKRVPMIFLEIGLDMKQYAGRFTGNLVLSSGDTTGYGLHADFVSPLHVHACRLTRQINGWSPGTLQDAISNCWIGQAADGDPRQCFSNVSPDLSKSCTAPNPFPEPLSGLMALPGNNPIGGAGTVSGNATAPPAQSAAPAAQSAGGVQSAAAAQSAAPAAQSAAAPAAKSATAGAQSSGKPSAASTPAAKASASASRTDGAEATATSSGAKTKLAKLAVVSSDAAGQARPTETARPKKTSCRKRRRQVRTA